MLEVVFKAVNSEFTLYAVARTAGAGTVGVAALDHEAGNDAVEGKTVIEAFSCKAYKIAYGLRCDVGIELELDDAAVFHLDGCDDLVHIFSLLIIFVLIFAFSIAGNKD